MKFLQYLAVMIVFTVVGTSCTNNNQNTGGIDSTSVSTNPGRRGIENPIPDSGMVSSDSTDIRMPMSDSSTGRTNALEDSSRQR